MITILLFLLLLAMSAFFSSAETAFFSLNPVRLEKLKRRDRSALRIELLKDDPNQLLATILLGNMFVNIFLSSLSAVIFYELLGQEGLILSALLITSLILFFGEIVPKSLAYYSAERVALFAAPIVDILNSIFYPISALIIKVSEAMFVFFFRGVHMHKEEVMTEEALKMALEVSVLQGNIDEDLEEMIQSVLSFSDIEASTVMTPRIDVNRISIGENRDKIEGMLKAYKHSYIPVYKDKIDNVVGILRTKDFFLKDLAIRQLMREPYFVPESKKIDDLLRELLKRKQKVAIVVDEHGGFSGIVSQEDIQEEIFGEIYDEYESEQADIIKYSDREYSVRAGTAIDDINYELDINIDTEEDNLAAYILDKIERLPLKGESFVFDDIRYTIESCTRRRILQVKITLKEVTNAE